MNSHSPTEFRRARASTTQRIVCGVAGFATSATLVTLTMSLFGAASSTPWLPDTPRTREMAATCARQAHREARERCMQRVLAAWQAERHDLRLAQARR